MITGPVVPFSIGWGFTGTVPLLLPFPFVLLMTVVSMIIVEFEYSMGPSAPGVPGTAGLDYEPPNPPLAFAARTIPVMSPARANSPRMPRSTGEHDDFSLASVTGGGGGGIVFIPS